MSSAPAVLPTDFAELAQRIDTGVAASYSSDGRADHYVAVADAVRARFDDEALTIAAFFHGLPESSLRTVEAVSPGARAILEDWHRLRALAPDDGKGGAHGFSGDARALILAIYDCLQVLDPQGELASWSRRFHLGELPSPWALSMLGEQATSTLHRAERVIAPLARAWGFWMEGNALLDAVLYHQQRARWDELVKYVEQAGHAGEGVPRSLASVRAALKGEVNSGRIRWEWRHLESVSRKLEGFREAEWPRALFRCGFVTVPCQDPDHCYRVLSRLHRACDYRRREVVDYVGSPSPAGYRALHTVLVVPDDKLGTMSVAARLVPIQDADRRHAFIGAATFSSLRLPHLVEGEARIRAYTPTGEQKELPIGSTVLDFVHAVFEPWVAIAEHAILNHHDKVDLLHVLEDGDEVRIHLGDKPRPLPAGWDEGRSEKSRDRILSGCRKGWNRALAKEGLAWLRRQLGRPQADDRLVSVLIDLALPEMEAEGAPRHKPGWWARQLGLHFGRLRPPQGLVRARIDAKQAQALLEWVEKKSLRLLSLHRRAEVIPPPELRGQSKVIHWCPICSPSRDVDLVVTIASASDGGEVVLHRKGELCAEGGLDLELQDRVALNQFFVIETNNEQGIALEVLEVFGREDVDIIEVVGRRLGPDWGVFRVQVDPVGRQSIREIVTALRGLDNVLSVRSPLVRQSGLLEAALPHRQTAHRNPFFRPFPFVAGPIVIEDHAFYARERELNSLHDLLRRVRAEDAEQGLMGFVHGPLRIGKTSLVRRFDLLLRRRPELRALPVYAKAHRAQRWQELRQRLDADLAKAAGEATKLWGVEFDEIEPGSLEARIEALTALPGRPSVVLVVDEVHRLFGTCRRHRQDLEGISAFRDFVERTPGLLVIWCGPTHGTRALHRDLTTLLQSAQPIQVRPLDFEDAHALLEARKLSLYHSITLDRGLARFLFNLTGGEPFWLAHLAHIMWMRAAESSSRIVRFENALVDRAKRDLLDKHDLFATRIEPHAAERAETNAWKVASALAARQGVRTRPRWGLTVDEITKHARQMGHELRAHDVTQALDTLQDRGAARQVDTDPTRWHITFRLLVEYLTLHQHQNS